MTRTYQHRKPDALFEPAEVGILHLANRIVMAPLTRNRAGPGLVPSLLAAEYYSHAFATAAAISFNCVSYFFRAGSSFGR